MNLYLIRHSKAEPGKPDNERKLSKDGMEILLNSIIIWKKHISSLDLIITSPLPRAFETAETISKEFNQNIQIVKNDNLLPGASTDSIIEMAASNTEEDIAFVGHQPDLSNIASELISNSGASIAFKAGAIALIQFDTQVRPGAGSLQFLLPPIR